MAAEQRGYASTSNEYYHTASPPPIPPNPYQPPHHHQPGYRSPQPEPNQFNNYPNTSYSNSYNQPQQSTSYQSHSYSHSSPSHQLAPIESSSSFADSFRSMGLSTSPPNSHESLAHWSDSTAPSLGTTTSKHGGRITNSDSTDGVHDFISLYGGGVAEAAKASARSQHAQTPSYGHDPASGYNQPSSAYQSRSNQYERPSTSSSYRQPSGPRPTVHPAPFSEPVLPTAPAAYDRQPSASTLAGYGYPQPPSLPHTNSTGPPPLRSVPSNATLASLRERRSPNLGSNRSGTMPPPDAFYSPATTEAYRPRPTTAERRAPVASPSLDVGPSGSSAFRRPSQAPPPPTLRGVSAPQPAIHTRAPSSPTAASPRERKASQNVFPTHPTFTSPSLSTGGLGSLSPSQSLSPNPANSPSLRRRPSELSFFNDDIGGGDGLSPFLNAAFLSNIAVFVRDNVPRGTRQKGALEHPQAFTGADLVSAVMLALPSKAHVDRHYALQFVRSLDSSLWWHEVDWSGLPVKDTSEGDVYTFPSESMDPEMDDLPTGVLTSLTPCISPFCNKLTEEGYSSTCYSYTCPNKAKNNLQRQASNLSSISQVEPKVEADNWASSVPKSVVESLTKDEVARQSLIFELIQGEVSLLADLDLIETGFVEPLRNSNPPIINPPPRLEPFLREVLYNVDEIKAHCRPFLDALLAKQKEGPVIDAIGPILLNAALEWGQAYVASCVHTPLGEACWKEEKSINPRFNDLLMDFSRLPGAKKREFDTFQTRPMIRLMRYPLLLEQILKHTKRGGTKVQGDVEYIEQAMALIKEQCKDSNEGIVVSQRQVSLRKYARNFVQRNGLPVDLGLLSENHTFFQAGKVLRRTEGAGFQDFAESHLVLFDSYLVTTKPIKEGRQKYVIERRPVPLDLIQLKPNSFSEPGFPRSSGFHLGTRRALGGGGSQNQNNTNNNGQHTPTTPNPGDQSLVYPITFFQLGKFNGMVTYYVDSHAVRKEWEAKFKEAIAQRTTEQEANAVCQLSVLSDRTFTANAIGVLEPTPAAEATGRPTCSFPLTTVDGQSLCVVGCQTGLFIGFRNRPASMVRVVALTGITQVAILPDDGFILVLADKVLIAYSLEALIPSGSGPSDPASRMPQRLSGQKDVLFFKAGVVGRDDKTLVIYSKRGSVRESVFKALEPVSHADRSKGGGGTGHRLFQR